MPGHMNVPSRVLVALYVCDGQFYAPSWLGDRPQMVRQALSEVLLVRYDTHNPLPLNSGD